MAGVRKMFFGCAQSTVDFFPLGTSEVFTHCSGLVDHIRLSLDQSRSVSSQLLFVYDDDIRLFELSVCLSMSDADNILAVSACTRRSKRYYFRDPASAHFVKIGT